ncbi:hypothetical protein TanjilG_04025 [Lupinus angustifolius]|uniref:Uncharacterized protein n=1 Tax=Lupinus angustifolius TaxID=3871 RepID=A0A4P1RB86_LUPAN|nr:hypothetical protein TanjilG_04025 [Lupinus angustifolius]
MDSVVAEIGADGIPREGSVITYTEKVFPHSLFSSSSQLFSLLLILVARKAALELLRKKIEVSTDKIRVTKLKEEQARKAWESASNAVKNEEAIKQKLCGDVSNLDGGPTKSSQDGTKDNSSVPNNATESSGGSAKSVANQSNGQKVVVNGPNQQPPNEGEGINKKKVNLQSKGKG